DSPLNAADDASLSRIIQMKSGFRLLREVDEKSRFLFVADDQITYDPDAVEKVLRKHDNEGLRVLRDLHQILSDVTHWTAPSLESAIKTYGDAHQLGLNKVAQP